MITYSRTILLIVLLFSLTLGAIGGRTPSYAKNGMVVSTSMSASEIGRKILKNGGNAIDAAVATAFALAVTWPAAGNIGGGGFLLYHGHDGTITAFDFREKAPLAATPHMYLDANGGIQQNSNHEGLLSVGVPGTVAGLYLAHQRLGSKPWKELLKPAIRLADKGFKFTWALHNHITKNLKPYLKKYPSSAKVMLKDGNTNYLAGEIWRQPDMAKTLKRIQKYGHDGFYKGKTARTLATFMKKQGGIITEADLAKYQAVERKPIHGNYRGYDVYAMCPPSSGGITLIEMLNILEGYNLQETGHNSAAYLHLLTEVMRRAFADRAQFLGDPDFNPNMPVKKLISKEYAKTLRAGIQLSAASESDSSLFNQAYESMETTHFSVVDAQKNAVSLTYTLEQSYGSKIVAEGLGFFLNNEMGDFNAIAGQTDSKGRIGTPANLISPEKRMLSSMTPTIIAKNHQPLVVIGSPGGRTIINTVLQVTLNLLDHHMNIAQAIEAPRIHHQWLPNITFLERWGISPDTQELYQHMGHHIRFHKHGVQGRAMGIYIDYRQNLLSGAADSRSADGGVAGY